MQAPPVAAQPRLPDLPEVAAAPPPPPLPSPAAAPALPSPAERLATLETAPPNAAPTVLIPLAPPPPETVAKPTARPALESASMVTAPAVGQADEVVKKALAEVKNGYRVQIYALASEAAVRREWPKLQKAHGDLFDGLDLIVQTTAEGAASKPLYRLQAGMLKTAAAARSLCDQAKQRKLNCIIVRP